MGCAGKVSNAGGTWTKSSATMPLPLFPLSLRSWSLSCSPHNLQGEQLEKSGCAVIT